MRAPPRYSLAIVCLLHALIFAWAASTLPWRSGTGFSVLLLLLTLLHVATAAAALARQPVALLWTWRALSAGSALAFVLFSWFAAATALYVSGLYTRLGPPVAGGIFVAALVFGLLTLPIAIWGALMTLPAAASVRQRLGIGTSLLIVVAVLTLPVASKAARGAPVAATDSSTVADVRDLLEAHTQQTPRSPRYTVAGAGPATCDEPVSPSVATAIVTYVNRRGQPRSACIQGGHGRRIRIQLRRYLRRHARPGSTVVVDLVRAVKPLSSSFPLLDALELRPGTDGVCEGLQCLPAWQLTMGNAFSEHRPFPAVPDASFGFSPDSVRAALGSSKSEGRGIDGLVRIEANTFVADETGVHQLARTRPLPPALTPRAIEEALEGAERYIIAAQKRDGSFRYELDPNTGKSDSATLNLPRQAGTTYALCELGQTRALRRVVRRALSTFAANETNLGEFSALANDASGFGLGRSALPLLALLRCRELAGPESDRLIGQLSRLLLHLQRDNGSFYPELDEATKRGAGEHELLYAAGQAVLALVLLEQQLGELKGSAAEPLPPPSDLARAIDRAMDFYGGPYWPRPVRDFFFFEEGWHCLAARTALTSHRHDAYERLCIDYVASRARFVLRAGDTAEPHFVGGVGVSDLFPPRNTATAGFGEALNAAIAIKQKRGVDVTEDKAMLKDLVSFLLRAQWSTTACYACSAPERVSGGFSEQLAAPGIRIDYVQHAMAAIGHGAKLLGLRQ